MSKKIQQVSQRSELISLQEAKNWLRVTSNREDSLINMLIESALDFAENTCKSNLAQRDYMGYFSCFSEILLPHPPICSIDEVGYIALGESNYTIINSSNYELNDSGFEGIIDFDIDLTNIVLKDTYKAIRVNYKAGYDSIDCPATIKDAMLAYIASRYDSRDDQNKRFRTMAEDLLEPYRIYNL